MIQFNMEQWRGVTIGEGATAREVKLFTSPQSKIQSEQFASGITVIEPGQGHEIHVHDSNLELQLIYNGTGILYSGGKEYPIKKGDVIGLGIGEDHGFLNTGDDALEIFWIYYPTGMAEKKFLIDHNDAEYVLCP